MTDESALEARLRQLPSVYRLLQTPEAQGWVETFGHELTTDAIREALDEARDRVLAGEETPSAASLLASVQVRLERLVAPTLRRAINATGVIIHTNLGRAPLSRAAREAMELAARGYTNLEYDLAAGVRGSRYVHAVGLLKRLTGAEDALVVNNNAGAVLLALSTLAAGREVIISRGQLVEIGGGFRIPDVMRQSGARLVEVGTTNRTTLKDYAAAISAETALLLRVHTSNFRIIGFTHQPSLAELVELGRSHSLLVMDDLGSGTLVDTAQYGLAHEPMVQESVAAGADVVTFSGDKLLGGPQAGYILGRRELIARMRTHPLTRALRVDKVAIAGIEATLRHYLLNEAAREIPVWRMIATPADTLRKRARAWARRLKAAGVDATVVEGQSTVGGGSLPGETLPTWLLALAVPSPDGFARALRMGKPAIVPRIEEDRVLFDPRTVLPDEDEALVKGILTAWSAA
ncbi:MAG: L-seryl-tRNA(Sec) selenium transferase [Anaerolineae bacterium]|nr:L-seryl-tRNA(Sec) selenium transferase [Anaerolineae bacterium]